MSRPPTVAASGAAADRATEVDPAVRLAANDFAYRQLCREVDRRDERSGPALLSLIEGVARFAWFSHPGRLADGALENKLLRIGRDLVDAPPPADLEPLPRTSSASRTLHVASEVYLTGGHSRVLAKWVQRDLSSSHAIVVTRQTGGLPAYLTAIAADREAPIATLDPREGILERARRLRALSRDFDRVILHHHPDDSVPVLAYAAPGGCPVAMFNHAHFWFSLGSGVADVIINTMPYFRQLTERHRFPRASDLLDGPFGLEPLRADEIDKERAKAQLDLPPDRPVAMTIGHEAYFKPSGGLDFFQTLAKLLAARPDLQVLVVGVREESPLVPSYIRDAARVRLVGPVADPRPYYEASDICLESFPMPSLGALTDAVTFGQAFPVPAYPATESPLRVNQPRIASISDRQPTEADYIRYICALLDAREATSARAAQLRRTLIQDDERFGAQFASLYERIAGFDHRPRELPRTGCSAAPENLALASVTEPRNIGNALSDLLPIGKAVRAHAQAVARGYESPRNAALGLVRPFVRPVFRRLPGALQGRLRPR
ncbi:MAG: hypothetical protein QOI38_950 [Sphingomonadales bacterium]|jgi:hypothetical protein|nr:hypothetical protein [Sphingomonadales bacterium]